MISFKMGSLVDSKARRVVLVTAICSAALMFTVGAARSQSLEEFFHGKQLTLYIGGGAGGAIDLYARLLARHIVKYLPGNPVISPRNLPAAGGVQAYMALANTAPRDGSAFATSARGPLSDPLYSDKAAPYDVRKFIWIGSMNDDSSVCYTRGESKIRTLTDAQQHEATMASTGVLAESSKFPIALNATIGTRFKVITGYSGTSNTLLAVERGETEGRCTTVGSINATQAGAIEKGMINILVQVGLHKRAELSDVPLALDLARTEEDKAFLRLLVAPLAIASAFALPEGVPADRAAVWRKAFAATLTDARYRDEAAKIRFEVTERSGPEVEEIVRSIYATPQPLIQRARGIFEPPR
jgi:tripartite-type tricarboxylate transporter receptor subunit TctC